MKSVCFEADDILQSQLSDKPVVREVSQGWNTCVAYADDGSIAQIVLLDARKERCLPLECRTGA
jgi:hypothetical protein